MAIASKLALTHIPRLPTATGLTSTLSLIKFSKRHLYTAVCSEAVTKYVCAMCIYTCN